MKPGSLTASPCHERGQRHPLAADCLATLERYVALGITEFNLSAVCPAPEMAEQYGRIAAKILPHFAR